MKLILKMKQENKKNKVGILIYYPFQYYVHKNIYLGLKKKGVDAYFIIDPTSNFPTRPNEETLEKTRTLLQREGVRFTEFSFDNFFSESLRTNFLQEYNVLISTWWRGIIKSANHQKKVFVTYGAGKELTTFGFWKRFFDLCLAYGDYDGSFFSQLTKTEIVGNPKFDDWFSKKFDTKLTEDVISKIDKNKKTLLYLPTHSDLSSALDLAEPLKKLNSTWNVIVKLHYYMMAEEPDVVAKLKQAGLILYEDTADLLTLFNIADVVLSDNSSAIFDAFLADKPTVVTDFHSKDYLDKEHRGTRAYRRGSASALTYSNSIEQRIKRDGTVMTIKNPGDLEKIVNESIFDPIEIKGKRRNLTEKLFKYNDNQAGSRAAEAILNLLTIKEEQEKPFLSHAVDFFELETIRKYYFSNSQAEFQENELVNEKNICFIIYDQYNNIDNINSTLLSLSTSKIETYHILTRIPSEEIYKKLDSGLLQKKIVLHSEQKIGPVLQKISYESEKIICLYAGCIFQTPEYLANAEDFLFKKNNFLSCAYVHKKKEFESIWDKLYDLELREVAGYNFYSTSLHSRNFYQLSNSFWNNPVDEPRFFIADTGTIKEHVELHDLSNMYEIFLYIKHQHVKQNKYTTLLPVGVIDTCERKGFYFSKKKIKILFEYYFSIKKSVSIKRQISLMERTLSFPYSKAYLFPFAFLAACEVFMLYIFVFLIKKLEILNLGLQRQK